MRGVLVRSRQFGTGLQVAAVIERRPVVYHMEEWETAHEAWHSSNRSSQQGRVDPSAKSVLSLQSKTSGPGKSKEEGGAAYSVKKKKLDLAAEFEALKRFNVTDADRAADTTSLLRALSRRLYLVVKDEKSGEWRFPTANVEESDKSLRETAERVARSAIAPYQPYLFGNCPVGHVDSSLFFFYGEIVWGEAMQIPDATKLQIKQFAWLTREELATRLPAKHAEAANRMLTKI